MNITVDEQVMLAGRGQLCDQRMVSFELQTLFGHQSSQETGSLVFSHKIDHSGKPIVRVVIQYQPSFPARIQEIFIGFRCFTGFHPGDVKNDRITGCEGRRHESLRVSKTSTQKGRHGASVPGDDFLFPELGHKSFHAWKSRRHWGLDRYSAMARLTICSAPNLV